MALVVAASLFVYLLNSGGKPAALFVIGIAMGIALYHASFGFTGAYRRAIVEKDIAGVSAQLIMIAAAMLLFAPILARGDIFGQVVVGAVAPVSVSMAFGALIFGIGMQLGGGCGSGTLYTVGGGNLRMIVVLIFFAWAGFGEAWISNGGPGFPGSAACRLANAWGGHPRSLSNRSLWY